MPIYSSNLWNYFKRAGNHNIAISMAVRFDLFTKILAGLSYIQYRGFKHLDIKLSNILIQTNNTSEEWDGTNCVITDFGIGGKTDKNVAKAGTPGFASPEQLIGQADFKSDNYSLGRLMIFIFSTWQGAWNLAYQPIENEVKKKLPVEPIHHDLFLVISNLIQLEPDSRAELTYVTKRMIQLKTRLTQISPVDSYKADLNEIVAERNAEVRSRKVLNFQDVGERTQCSVVLHKEIEAATEHLRHKIPNRLATQTVHDQMGTHLCTSFATISTLRAAQIRYLSKKRHFNPKDLRKQMKGWKGDFSFNNYLTLFTGCVSLRNLEGLIINSTGMLSLMEKQQQIISTAVYRLVYETVLDVEGKGSAQSVQFRCGPEPIFCYRTGPFFFQLCQTLFKVGRKFYPLDSFSPNTALTKTRLN